MPRPRSSPPQATRCRRAAVILAPLAASLVAPSAAAQPAPGVAPPLALVRLASPVTLDGRSDEAAWAAVQPIVPVMALPTFGGQPSAPTEFRFAHDDTHLYASARMYVRDPGELRGNSLQRDRLGSDDVFRVLIDSYNDNESGVAFATTPTGVRVDFAVASDGQSVNYDWNSYWDVAVARSDSGWFAEMRIPLSSLRYQVVDGTVTMGLLAMRRSSARNETVTHPEAPPRFASAMTRPSLGQKIALAGVRPQRPLWVTPYLLGGGTSRAVLDEPAAAWRRERSTAREVGGDLKYGLTSNLTLDLTVNTDFAQAEADDQQVNLTRFSLFFPEKRQFFLERASVFDFTTGGSGDPSRLFNSRQIGLTDEGIPIGIAGGARLVGRVGGWDLAALNMQTEGAGERRAENFGVLRLRRRVLNERSTVGGILTSRVSEGGAHNQVLGADAVMSMGSNDYLTLQAAQSFDDERPTSGLRGAMVRGLWERRAAQGLVYRLGAKWSGPDHDPELGFLPRRDFTHVEGNLRYGWYFGERTVLENFQPSLLVYTFVRNRDGVAESVQGTGYLNFALKNGFFGNVNASTTSEVLPAPLALSPTVQVPAGRHTFTTATVFIGPPNGWRWRTGVQLTAGEFYDGRQVVASLTPTAVVSPKLEVGAEYQLRRIRFPQRDQSFAADLARLRVQAALDTRLSASGYLQYNRAARTVASNVRLRLHLAEGRDLFVVYNDRLNTEREAAPVALPLSQERTLLVKMVYGVTR